MRCNTPRRKTRAQYSLSLSKWQQTTWLWKINNVHAVGDSKIRCYSAIHLFHLFMSFNQNSLILPNNDESRRIYAHLLLLLFAILCFFLTYLVLTFSNSERDYWKLFFFSSSAKVNNISSNSIGPNFKKKIVYGHALDLPSITEKWYYYTITKGRTTLASKRAKTH